MKNAYTYETAIGQMTIMEDGNEITDIYFGPSDILDEANIVESPMILETRKQLEEYFQQERRVFNLPLNPKGTEFQKKVWKELLEIPYGETRSYGEVAKSIDQPKASRAIGMANNRNPIMIVIPCHRVIGANGKLVGYGGGISMKSYLLDLENKI